MGVCEICVGCEAMTTQPPSIRVWLWSFCIFVWILVTQPPSARVRLRCYVFVGARAHVIDNAAPECTGAVKL